jgi:spore maturation protein CgeB
MVPKSVQHGESCSYQGDVHIPSICDIVGEYVGYPDAILMENWKNMRRYTGGHEVDCFKAFIVCDYYPDSRKHFMHYNDVLNRLGVDLAICNTPDVLKNVRSQQEIGHLPGRLKSVFISQGVDTDIFMPLAVNPLFDVMAVYGLVSYIYPTREAVQKAINSLPGVTSLIGNWKSNIKHEKYAESVARSKIFVCANGINNQVLMKYFEVMSSGTLLLTNMPRDCKAYGFIPGKHFAVWSDIDDLVKKIYFYLEHESVRESIAAAGMKFVRSKFSTKKIASEIVDKLSIGVQEKESIPYASGIA